MLQELVGDVQLAVEEELMEALHEKDMSPGETELVLKTSMMVMRMPLVREESALVDPEEHDVVHRKECRHRESAADYGCSCERSSEEETAVPTVCCGHGFLKGENQQKEDDYQQRLVVKDKKTLSYEVRLLSLEATSYSTWLMVRYDILDDHELALLALEKRVLKSSRDMDMVPVDVLLVMEGLAVRDDDKKAMTVIQKQSSKMKGVMKDIFKEFEYVSHSLIIKHDADAEIEYARKLMIDHKEETAVTTSGKQSRERIHLLLLSFYIAQKSRFGQKLLQRQFVSLHSNRGLWLMEKVY